MDKICYCELGAMSQCVAKDLIEQQACHFSDQSSVRKACMHLNADLNNHCWNPAAQAFSREHGVVRIEDVESATIDDEHEEPLTDTTDRRTCMSCLQYACSNLVAMAAEAQHNGSGGLNSQDYWEIGSGCPEYINENEFMEEV